MALQNKVIADRAKTLKEAIPIPISIIVELEGFVVDPGKPIGARIFLWWILCMVFASLRFDDAIHVHPGELTMRDEGLFGVAWQTKVDRKRMGTRFVVPKIGFFLTRLGWRRGGSCSTGRRISIGILGS